MPDISEFIELFNRFPKDSQIFQFVDLLRADGIDFPNSNCFSHLQNPDKCALYLKRWLRVQLKEISKNDLLLHDDLSDVLDSTPQEMCRIFKQWFPIARVRHLRADKFCHTNISTLDILYFFVGDIELKWPLEDYLIAANSQALIGHWGLQNRVSNEEMLDNWRLRLNYYNYCRTKEIKIDDIAELNNDFQWEPEHSLFTRERSGIKHSRVSGPEISAARKLLQAFDFLLDRSVKRPYDFFRGNRNPNLSFEEMGYQLVELVYSEIKRAERIGDNDNVIYCDFQENQNYFQAVNSLETIGGYAGETDQNLSVRTIINDLYKLTDVQTNPETEQRTSAISSLFLSHTLHYIQKLLRSRRWLYNQVLTDYDSLCEVLIRNSMTAVRQGFDKVPESQLHLFYDGSAYARLLGITRFDSDWRKLHDTIPQVFFGKVSMFEFDEEIPEELNTISVYRSFQLMFFFGFVKHHWMLFFHAIALLNLGRDVLREMEGPQSYFKQLRSESFINAVNEFHEKILSKSCAGDSEVVNTQYANRVLPRIDQARSAAIEVFEETFRYELQEVAEAAMEEGAEQ